MVEVKNPEGLRRDASLLLEHKLCCTRDEFEEAARGLGRDYGLDQGEVWDYLAELEEVDPWEHLYGFDPADADGL